MVRNTRDRRLLGMPAFFGAALALLLGNAGGAAQEVRSVSPGADPSAMVSGGTMWIYPTSRDGLQA
jgi:hypothetical protein